MEKNQRPRRESINGRRNILTVKGEDPNYKYRFVNDIDTRIKDMEQIGYEIVRDKDIKVGDKRVANPSQEGSPITVTKGTTTQYLMRIKKEWYDEDQKAKQDAIDKQESSMKADAVKQGMYGKIEITRS